MSKKISDYSYIFNHDNSQAKWKLKDKLIQPIEDALNIRIGEYKNYILTK